MSAETDFSYQINLLANTVNVLWQLHVTYIHLSTGLTMFHKVSKYQLIRSAVITNFDTFQIELADGSSISLPPSPTVGTDGSTTYPEANPENPLTGNFPVLKSWNDRAQTEIATAVKIYAENGNEMGYRNPCKYCSTPIPADEPCADVFGVSAVVAAQNLLAIQDRFKSFIPTDPLENLETWLQYGFDNTGTKLTAVAANLNYQANSPIGMKFLSTTHYSELALWWAIANDRFIILAGGYGQIGGPAAAKARYDAMKKVPVALQATFTWKSQDTGSINVPKAPGISPYFICTFGSETKQVSGNTSSQKDQNSWGASVGVSIPFGAGEIPFGTFSDTISVGLTKTNSKNYAISIDESRQIIRNFDFYAPDRTKPFYMAYIVWQLNIDYAISSDPKKPTISHTPDIFVVRSQVTEKVS